MSGRNRSVKVKDETPMETDGKEHSNIIRFAPPHHPLPPHLSCLPCVLKCQISIDVYVSRWFLVLYVILLKHSFSSFAFPELVVVLIEVFCVQKHLWLQNEAEICLSIHPAISLGAALLKHPAARPSSAVYLTFCKHHLKLDLLVYSVLGFYSCPVYLSPLKDSFSDILSFSWSAVASFP